MSCHSVGGRGGEFRLVDNHRATFHHPTHIFDDDADVGERIALHCDDAGKVARPTEPRRVSMPSISAGMVVAVFSACSLVIPIFTNHASSRMFRPKPLYTASDPRTIFAPALKALVAVAKFRWI